MLAFHPEALLCAEANHVATDQGFTGVDFNEDKDGVWFEGSAHLAVAYEKAGEPTKAEALRLMLAQAQSTPPSGDGSGIAAASRDGLTTGFGFSLFRRLHVGATAWNVFAQLAFNPFYGVQVHRGELFTLTACRLLDTRTPGEGPALTSEISRALATIGKCGIPPSAVALIVNVTVVGPTGPGYLTLHPGDQPLPLAATINFASGQIRTNNAIVPVAVDGEGSVRLHPLVGGNGSVHVILDVSGYFE